MIIYEMSRHRAGFSLVELVVVIAIISILASFSIPIYLKYQKKSKVSSFALPIASACAKDLITYCIDLNLENQQVIDLSNANVNLKNCNITNAVGNNLTVTISGSVVCEISGMISNGTVSVKIEGINDYVAKCYLSSSSLRCLIE